MLELSPINLNTWVLFWQATGTNAGGGALVHLLGRYWQALSLLKWAVIAMSLD